MQTLNSVKILYGYPYFPSNTYLDVEQSSLQYIRRLQNEGFDVEGFCLTLNPPASCCTFPEMNIRWILRDKTLLKMYESLEKKLEGKDVLLNASGINLHPEFVSKLKVFTVFQCFDDPESSNNLSRPVARAYDLCLVGNIAEVDTYRNWGASNVEWIPLGLFPGSYDTSLTYDMILNGERDIGLFMMIDRSIKVRKERLNKLENAFPNSHFYGKGWARGYLSYEQEINYLKRARIGPNLHLSTGPINFRTYYLPANGVMQICDNKSNLGKIYDLNKEVVGFDTVEECIELCQYYLAHDNERKQIAANGWKRAIADYDEVAVFKRTMDIIQKYMENS